MHVGAIQAWGLALLLIRLSVGNRELARASQSRPKEHLTAEKTDVSSRNQIENHRSGLREQFLAPIWVWGQFFQKP